MLPVPRQSASHLVAVVATLNVLGFVDRQMLVALAPLLIGELGLTRAQIGLLVGVSFIGVFAVGTLLVGVLADRYNRPRLMATGLAIWSAATALTGTAHGMASLVGWRSLVGAGEAMLPATALAMIGDRVPAGRLGLATGVYYAGVPVGFAISFAIAGMLGPRLGWRACFVALGALGLAGSLLVSRLHDPPRRDAAPDKGKSTPPRGVWSALRERPMILWLTAAGTLLVYSSASSQHAITWLVAERGFDYSRAALLSAAVILVAGLTGNLVIGAITDRAGQAHPAARLASLGGVSAVGLLAAAGFYSLSPDSWSFYVCWLVAQAFLLGWYGSLVAAVHERAPEGHRASVIGFTLMSVNLLGVASGPYLTGLVGDRISLAVALLWSLVPGAMGALLLGVLGLSEWRAGRHGR